MRDGNFLSIPHLTWFYFGFRDRPAASEQEGDILVGKSWNGHSNNKLVGGSTEGRIQDLRERRWRAVTQMLI